MKDFIYFQKYRTQFCTIKIYLLWKIQKSHLSREYLTIFLGGEIENMLGNIIGKNDIKQPAL